MRSDYRMLWLGPAGLEPLQKFSRVRYWVTVSDPKRTLEA